MSARSTVKSIQDLMRQDVGVDGDAQRLSQLCWMFFLKIIDDQDQQLEVMQDGYRSPIPEKLQWRTWAADPEGITGDALMSFVNDDLFPTLKELPTSGPSANRARVVRGVFEDAYNYMKSGHLMRQVVNKINAVDFNDLAERKHFGEVYEQLLNDLQNAGNAGEYYTPRAVTAFMVDRIDPRPGEVLFDPACGTGGFLTCAIRHMRDRYVKTVQQERSLQSGLRAVEKKPLPHMLCVTNMLLHGIEDPGFVRHDNTLARPYISWEQKDRVDIILANPPFGGREEDGIESNFPAHFRTKETADLFLALFIRLLKPGGHAAVVLPDGSLFGEGVKTRLKEALLEECNLHTIVRLPNSVFKPYASIGTNLLFFKKGGPTRDIWFYEHRVPAGQKAYSMTKPIRVEHFAGCVDWWGGADRSGRVETEQAWKVTADEVKARGYNLDIKNPHAVVEDHGDPPMLLAELEEAQAETVRLREQLEELISDALLHDARRPDSFVVNSCFATKVFTALTARADQIKQIRQAILNLAIRGKLVPQRSGEEPVASSSGLETGTHPAIPLSWRYVRLEHLLAEDTRNGYSRKPDDATDGVPILRISAGTLRRDGVVAEEEHKLISGIDDALRRQLGLREGDLLACRFNGNKSYVGRLTIFQDYLGLQPIFPDKLIRVRVDESEASPSFIRLAGDSDLVRAEVERLCATTVGNWGISATNLKSVRFPLPPLTEQKRIVAKVEQLMSLCDQLEESLAAGDRARSVLLDAVLHEALESSSGSLSNAPSSPAHGRSPQTRSSITV